MFAFIILVFGLFSVFSFARASVTPTLTLSTVGDGNSVILNVAGDPNTNVLFLYTKSGVTGQQNTSLGNTDGSGLLRTTISSATYGISAGSLVRIVLGSMAGLQSPDVAWPTAASLLTSNNLLTLSQTSLSLTLGQNSTLNASNLNNGSLYLASNSNPVVANFNISGSQILVLANSYGSTTGTFCLVSSPISCVSVYVVVSNGSNSAQASLTFSQNSVSIFAGQTISIQIYGGSAPYAVSNNSSQNSSLVNASIAGSTLTLTTTATTAKATSITVCGVNGGACGIINVAIVPATIPTDCTGALYSVSTGLACPVSTATTTPTYSNTPTSTPTTSTETTTTKAVFKFTKYLQLGATGTEVLELQTKLKTLGYYKGKIDGGFGATTEKAVKAFQKAHKLPQAGSVGPKTRALLNK